MNSILKTAHTHYDPSIVKINLDAISTINVPSYIPPSQIVPVQYSIENIPEFWISSIVVMNTLNYQFWDVVDGEMIRYRRDGKSGALVMGECFWQAWHDAIPADCRHDGEKNIIKALGGTLGNLRKRIEDEGIESIFGDIPNPESRKGILLEVMTLIPLLLCVDRIKTQIQALSVDGEFLASLLANYFPKSYNDVFLKKAQLTLMLCSSEYTYRHPDVKVDLSATIAADYQVPKVMRSMGILEYSDDLSAAIANNQLIASGSKEELAIRAATILAGEEISKKAKIAVPQIDWWIWSQRNNDPSAKFHLTRTTDY